MDSLKAGKVLEKIRTKGFEVEIENGLTLFVSDTIENFSDFWDESNTKGVLNSYAYLKSLEESMPKGLKNFYALIVNEDLIRGLLQFQIKDFDLNESLSLHTHNPTFWNNLLLKMQKASMKFVKHDLLILGNILLTGQYGINLCNDFSFDEKLILLDKCIEGFSDYMNNSKGFKIRSVLVKDFKSEQDQEVKLPTYLEFKVDPYMSMEIRWDNFEAYLSDLKSKYRVRYKRAIKKGSGVEVKRLDLESLNHYIEDMYSLYKQISTNVSFNLFDLHKDYFIKLKENLKDDILFNGVFFEGKMIAFYSLIYDADANYYDAHFLGYDMSHNRSKQTYLNMLYNMIEDSINKGVDSIHMSRTAMEIKSSVGATGENLFLLLKHRSRFVNYLMSLVLEFYVPDNSWLPRNPFK